MAGRGLPPPGGEGVVAGRFVVTAWFSSLAGRRDIAGNLPGRMGL
jgi:hypothetical protein